MDIKQPELFTPHVTADTNFKEFFLKHDGINNLTDQLIFSIFEKYRCYAGCNMCYLKPHWMSKTEMVEFTPNVSSDQEARLVEFFTWFDIASTHDDLHAMKKDHPDLFAFYERNSSKMWYAGMTDISLIQQQPIIEQLDFQGVYEVTISETFIKRNDGKVFDAVIERMTRLIKNTALTKMKIIIETPGGEDNRFVGDLIAWTKANNIPVGRHNDFISMPNAEAVTLSTDYVEGYQVVDAVPIMILSESIHGHCGDLYMTLADATKRDGLPYFNIFNRELLPSQLVIATLRAKIEKYAHNSTILTLAPNKPMRDYCKYVSRNVVVHDDFTFIPNFLIGSWTKIHSKLVQEGFQQTQYGLIRNNATKIIPIISFQDTQ